MSTALQYDAATESAPEWEQAKSLLVDIIITSGGSFAGMTKLYKAFYFAHLFYYIANSEHLTSHFVVRMPQGPGIDRGPQLLAQLEREGIITQGSRKNGPYTEQVYTLCRPAAPTADAKRQAAIDATIAYIADKTAAQLSAITHEYSRAWKLAGIGEPLVIPLDALSEAEFEERRSLVEESRAALQGLFG